MSIPHALPPLKSPEIENLKSKRWNISMGTPSPIPALQLNWNFSQEYQALSPTIDGHEGWYQNKLRDLYYFATKSEGTKKLVLGPLSPYELEDIIMKAKHSKVLIACPHTNQGENGYYMDKRGVVSRWIIDETV